MAHLEEEPGDPAAGRADVPPALSWTIRQALAKDPSRRPPAAGTLARMLRLAAADSRPTGSVRPAGDGLEVEDHGSRNAPG
jgi:hypothetical protein